MWHDDLCLFKPILVPNHGLIRIIFHTKTHVRICLVTGGNDSTALGANAFLVVAADGLSDKLFLFLVPFQGGLMALERLGIITHIGHVENSCCRLFRKAILLIDGKSIKGRTCQLCFPYGMAF